MKKNEHGMECTYEEMRRDAAVLEAVEDSLVAEQGGLCAYTGRRIGIRARAAGARNVSFHIEHPRAQKHCGDGEDADYSNIVACWPQPNCGFEVRYGAVVKKDWPAVTEEHLFLSPLRPDCSERFTFERNGVMRASDDDDQTAKTTIAKLNLNDSSLQDLRRNVIAGVLRPNGRHLSVRDARKLLRQIEQDSAGVDSGGTARLIEFCFAVEPALRRKIRQLEAIKPR